MEFPTVWFWRGGRLNSRWYQVARYTSGTWPHPTTVISLTPPDGESPVTSTSLDEQGHLVVDTSKEHWLEGTLDLWFVLVPDERGITKTYTLAAFADAQFADGTIVEMSEVRERKIPLDGSVAAIRWRQQSCIMEQIYVAEDFRRKRISTKLISIADTVIAAMGSAVHLNGGEATTGDGEKLRQVWGKSKRVRERNISVD